MTDGAAHSKLVASLVVVLLILHYDFWLWSDRSLVLGFMPVGLFYQALISLLAGLSWLVVVKYGWPARLEQWASDGEAGGSGGRPDDADA